MSNAIDRLAAALGPFIQKTPETKSEALEKHNFAGALSDSLEAQTSTGSQNAVTERRIPAIAGPAVEAATVNGCVDPGKLATALGGQITYNAPNWSGPFAPPNPLSNTWLVLPNGGGKLNVANLMYSLNTLNTPENREGVLSAMMYTAEALAKTEVEG